ncbi:MAG TPA: hypothetical protein VGI26_03930 [Solirubrobacteraceae bacterium]
MGGLTLGYSANERTRGEGAERPERRVELVAIIKTGGAPLNLMQPVFGVGS